MEPVLTRRDVLMSLALAALAGAGLSAGLSACGSEGTGGGGGDGLDLVSSDVSRAGADAGAVPPVAAALQRFGGGLYERLARTPGNLALSPYSVAVALAMTLNGAVGTTADEMRAALALDGLDVEALNGGLNALEQALEKLAGPVQRDDGSDAEIALAVASALFGERTETWKGPFLDALARDYGAGMRTVDFKTASGRARELINDWTAEQTADKIPELIPDGVLSALTRLVLVNALYLKAPWETPFEKQLTAPGDFHLSDGSVVQVDLMRAMMEGTPVRTGEGFRAVRLPYAGRRLAMTVVLPDEGRLEAVERRLARDGVGTLLGSGGSGGADVTLPRWTFRTASALKDALVALGMPTAFDEALADFSGMTDDEPLHIDAVLHEVFIAVDEEGTEAAAATAVVMNTTSAPVTEPFVVDRPFLFVIHDERYATPLFLGRVSDPRAD